MKIGDKVLVRDCGIIGVAEKTKNCLAQIVGFNDRNDIYTVIVSMLEGDLGGLTFTTCRDEFDLVDFGTESLDD